ncbi:MAG: hypothetical protein ACOYB2_10855 [Limnohabitans sp.]
MADSHDGRGATCPVCGGPAVVTVEMLGGYREVKCVTHGRKVAKGPATRWPHEDATARESDPDTSHEAAKDARAMSGKHRMLALAALREAGPRGLTDFELADATGVAQTSIGVRRKELVRAGYVEATDARRPAPSGSAAIVWRVVAGLADLTSAG